ncbi:MAG: hypothetical protein R3C49_20020 [Planctomycetaceae bacterium]
MIDFRNLLTAVLAGGMILVADANSVFAHWCPFCDAPSLTMSEQVDQSQHLLLGRWLGGDKATPESAGTARFRITEVARSKDDAFTVDQEIQLPQYIAGDEDASYVLMGPDIKLVDWHVPSEATQESWKYISHLPPPATEQEDKVRRLEYFIPYLQHPELTVSNDVYAEFAAAPYEVIKPVWEKLPREKLRHWVLDPETPVTRLGLYGLLLGLCGNEEDAAAMKEKILQPTEEFRLGIEGVMAGYVLITGEAGLKILEDQRMNSTTYQTEDGEEKKIPFSEIYACMQTLRFLWTYEPDRVPKQRLKESMRILLPRPELADLVIADLARWEDWDIQEQLMAMYDQPEFDIPSVKRAIVRYLFYCSEVKQEGTEEPTEQAAAALERLRVLEEKDPKTVTNAKRFLIR